MNVPVVCLLCVVKHLFERAPVFSDAFPGRSQIDTEQRRVIFMLKGGRNIESARRVVFLHFSQVFACILPNFPGQNHLSGLVTGGIPASLYFIRVGRIEQDHGRRVVPAYPQS